MGKICKIVIRRGESSREVDTRQISMNWRDGSRGFLFFLIVLRAESILKEVQVFSVIDVIIV